MPVAALPTPTGQPEPVPMHRHRCATGRSSPVRCHRPVFRAQCHGSPCPGRMRAVAPRTADLACALPRCKRCRCTAETRQSPDCQNPRQTGKFRLAVPMRDSQDRQCSVATEQERRALSGCLIRIVMSLVRPWRLPYRHRQASSILPRWRSTRALPLQALVTAHAWLSGQRALFRAAARPLQAQALRPASASAQ